MPKMKFDDNLDESECGVVESIVGPVIVAKQMMGTAMNELVRVGDQRLLGEVIRLKQDTVTIQMYEDTRGICYGDNVIRTGRPLSVELGPGILDIIYDGIQRPLREIQHTCQSIYIPRGISVPAVSRSKYWEFEPAKIKRGALLTGGDIIGVVYESKLVTHKIMVPPYSCGKVKYIAPPGDYTVDEVILQMEYEDTVNNYSMLQRWPVRKARPYVEKVRAQQPLFTGQRVFDGIFPSTQGGSTAVPGAFGCGKTVISQCLTKYSNSDVVVYIGCGERGNEMCELLRDFPELEIEVGGMRETIMKRTVLVANTSNMPVAAREASVYTGITFAEYFRDQGYNVTLMADSTTRWAEAMREISNRLGEMPADSGYPAYLSTRLASFYERGGCVRCIGNPTRFGSISVVGVVSPPAGDISEPFTAATLSLVQAFWALDKKLAERKHFPAVDWLTSYSNSISLLEEYYESQFPRFIEYRCKAVELLQQENDVKQLMNLVGHECLSDQEKIVLETSALLRDDFLQQNSYSDYDKSCPFFKTFGMLRNIITFHYHATNSMAKLGCPWNSMRVKLKEILYRLGIMKFMSPITETEEFITQELDTLFTDMQRVFDDL